MSIETLMIALSLSLSLIAIYLNLCYLRATHRSTVYAKFCGRNLRTLSLSQISMALSNIIFTAAVWGSRANRTKRSEAFFSSVLALTQAIPITSIVWVTVERVLFNRLSAIRDTNKFRYIAIFRITQTIVSLSGEILIRLFYDTDDIHPSSSSVSNTSFVTSSPSPVDVSNDTIIRNSLVANYYYDYYHGILYLLSLLAYLIVWQLARNSYKRACLLGGMRNEQKIQNLKMQISFMKTTYLPLYICCASNYLINVYVKRGILSEMDENVDIIYIALRSYLPIMYPLSLVILHGNLRTDYFANFCLCRKARNFHKESKVKVIATRESQESIIANLKMIGILSDVDAVPPQGTTGPAMSVKRPNSTAMSTGGRMTHVVSRDPSSNTSNGSGGHRLSSSSNGPMLFAPRNKTSFGTVG